MNGNGIGKCSESIKVAVPPDLKDELTALAKLHHQTLADYGRDVWIIHCRGQLSLLRSRLLLPAPKKEGSDEGQSGA